MSRYRILFKHGEYWVQKRGWLWWSTMQCSIVGTWLNTKVRFHTYALAAQWLSNYMLDQFISSQPTRVLFDTSTAEPGRLEADAKAAKECGPPSHP